MTGNGTRIETIYVLWNSWCFAGEPPGQALRSTRASRCAWGKVRQTEAMNDDGDPETGILACPVAYYLPVAWATLINQLHAGVASQKGDLTPGKPEALISTVITQHPLGARRDKSGFGTAWEGPLAASAPLPDVVYYRLRRRAINLPSVKCQWTEPSGAE